MTISVIANVDNAYLLILWQRPDQRDAFNHEEVLVVLPDSREEAKSIKEITKAMGMEISSYVDWVRAERRLLRALSALIEWGWVACDNRQKEDGHKFWYKTYWKTELAK